MLQKQYHVEALNLILRPSWLSGFIAILAGLVVTLGVIVAFSANNSQIQQQITVWQEATPTHDSALTQPDQVLHENDKPTLQGSWPLLIFWSVLGLGVYALATFIIKSIGHAEAFRESLNYVHADKHLMLQTVGQHIAIRLGTIGLWALFAAMFFKYVIPYSITAAHASAADVMSVYGVVYAVASFLSIAVSMHAHAIFMRLSIGKVRVFTNIG